MKAAFKDKQIKTSRQCRVKMAKFQIFNARDSRPTAAVFEIRK
jgi:hypothetical protein